MVEMKRQYGYCYRSCKKEDLGGVLEEQLANQNQLKAATTFYALPDNVGIPWQEKDELNFKHNLEEIGKNQDLMGFKIKLFLILNLSSKRLYN